MCTPFCSDAAALQLRMRAVCRHSIYAYYMEVVVLAFVCFAPRGDRFVDSF
jgi:hypothetical protein